MANMILDFGKNKGKTIGECDEQYLKWLVSHVKVLALRNRWSSRDAAFELDRRAWAQEEKAALARIAELEAAMAEEPVIETSAPTRVWSYEKCCYVWSDTGDRVEECDKPMYRIVGSSSAKRERFDLVGYVTKKNEDKRNMRAECREIKERASSERMLKAPLN